MHPFSLTALLIAPAIGVTVTVFCATGFAAILASFYLWSEY